MKQGTFITFEGCEGVGKSTQIKRLQESLSQQGKEVISLREPGGTSIGETIRARLKSTNLDPLEELYQFNIARYHLVTEVIAPALESGKIVLCDRFTDSTIAYQEHGRGINNYLVRFVIQVATQGINPDLTFFLDAKPQIGLAHRINSTDPFEQENIEFHNRVYMSYKSIIALEPNRFRVIPYLEGNPEEMQSQIQQETNKYLEKTNRKN
ncbi:dTMP kinase [Candidatus Pacearchaeota archaeon CG10_big_fil_rev_8_21_14_0_10_31_24]|nr:MAG: dTMP kinase [Candidatus Pacearchaeota archaeon CG10_big_fil_rev_8_21_14_0_10_31_24]